MIKIVRAKDTGFVIIRVIEATVVIKMKKICDIL